MSLSRIATLLHEASGLAVESSGAASLKSAVRRRMAVLEVTELGHYWEQLKSSPAELQELVEEAAVPETWFFRDPEAFTALAALGSPQGKRLILSAPCSTGEEPYSIAMCALQAGWAASAFHVEAVDISHQALARARRAIYGSHSFRGETSPWQDLFFRRRGESFELRRTVREQVRFRQGNLLRDDWAADGVQYQVIFCRNVLIYFDQETQGQVLARLQRLLAPEGVLFVGAAEAYQTQRAGFQSTLASASFVHRRADSPETQKVFRPAASRPARVAARRPVRPAKAIPEPMTEVAEGPLALSEAKRLADAGRLEEARSVGEKCLSQQPSSVEACYLLGLVHDSLGARPEAEKYYRKVLYLQPDHAEALCQLALLVERAGDRAGAQRLQMRARRHREEVQP